MGAMTESANGPVARAIAERLNAAFDPVALEVINDSAKHRGHMGDDGSGESHFTVHVTSPAFSGRTRVERQRAVNKALADLLEGQIHALAIRARAPGEA